MSNPVLEICGLVAGHDGRDVLRKLSLTIAPGEWLVLIGANGSGKSSLLDCVVGRLAPRSGSICVAGHSIASSPLQSKQCIGYAIPVERLPPMLTGRECLSVQSAVKGSASIATELLDLAESLRLAAWLDEPVMTWSYGTRQKLAILIALVGEPKLIVLDEAFNGLDLASGYTLKRHLRALVNAGRCSVILATHALDIAEHWADRVVLLDNGEIANAWARVELDGLRQNPGGFEAALVTWPN